MTRKELLKLPEPAGLELYYYTVCQGDLERTGFIIDDLLPAVRNNEKFKKDFWEWMHHKLYNENDEIDCWTENGISIKTGKTGEVFIIHNQPNLLLDFELKFCREILGKENV